MYRTLILTLFLVLFSVAMVMAEEKGPNESNGTKNTTNTNTTNTTNGSGDSDAKTLKGMSVLGNNEAPMSLFIVPWKSSELGVETSLTRTLNERDVPVDRDVFMREVAFYQVSVGSKNSAPAAGAQNFNTR